MPTTSQDPTQVPHQSDLSRCSCIAPPRSQQRPACAPLGSLCPKWKRSRGRNFGDSSPSPAHVLGSHLQAVCTVPPFLTDEGNVHSMPVKRARLGPVPLLRWVYQWGGPGSTRARTYNQPCLLQSPGLHPSPLPDLCCNIPSAGPGSSLGDELTH